MSDSDNTEFKLEGTAGWTGTLEGFIARPNFTDMVLVAEGERFLCHRVVLQSASNYFKRELERLDPELTPIFVLDEVLANSVQTILSYLYTGKVLVASSGLPKLLNAAHYLEIQSLVELLQEANISAEVTSDLEVSPAENEEEILETIINMEESSKELEEVIAITTRNRDVNQLSDYYKSPTYSTQPITKEADVPDLGQVVSIVREEEEHRPGGRSRTDTCLVQPYRGPQWRKKQSKVWDYFVKTESGSTVVCSVCGLQIKYSSNTTTMARHIKKLHQKEERRHPEMVEGPLPAHSLSNAAETTLTDGHIKQNSNRDIGGGTRNMMLRSPVWTFFTRLGPEVQCNICGQTLLFSHNTSNLRLHLRTKHKQNLTKPKKRETDNI